MGRTSKTKSLSPAMQLLTLVWEHNCKAVPHAWERVNHAMHTALSLAIGAGLKFDIDDFRKIATQFRFGYWSSATGGEHFYRTAVESGNLLACRAFEAYKRRDPLLADNVSGDRRRYHSNPYLHLQRGRKRQRLYVGAAFDYAGYRPTVTSLCSGHATACTYHTNDDGGSRRRIAKRFRVTAADLKRNRAERKRLEGKGA